jgi:hypothetical protein
MFIVDSLLNTCVVDVDAGEIEVQAAAAVIANAAAARSVDCSC